MKRLLVLHDGDTAADPRPRRFVSVFSSNAEVRAVSRAWGRDIAGGIALADHRGKFFRRLSWLLNYALRKFDRLDSRFIADGYVEQFSEWPPDWVAVFDLGLVPLAGEFKRVYGSKVYCDLREYYPGQSSNRFWWRMLKAPYQKHLLRQLRGLADVVTSVSPSLCEKYQADYGLQSGLLMSIADVEPLAPQPTGRPIRYVHHGAAITHRGIEELIEAFSGVDSDYATLDFYLMKSDPSYFESLQSRVADLPGVRVREAVAYSELYRTLNEYDVGIFVPPASKENNLYTLPNKFFDYLLSGLAVVVGPEGDMADLVRQHGVGGNTLGASPEAIREGVLAMRADLIPQFKGRAHALARELNWIEESRKLREWIQAKEG